MAQLTNRQRAVANLPCPATESNNDVPCGEWNETSMMFSHEFEHCIIELADEVYGLSNPKEIAQRVLRKACEFYDADWCGIFDADMMLRLWMPFWWYNRATGGMTKTKTDMDQHGILGELPRWKNAIEQNSSQLKIHTQRMLLPSVAEIDREKYEISSKSIDVSFLLTNILQHNSSITKKFEKHIDKNGRRWYTKTATQLNILHIRVYQAILGTSVFYIPYM